MQLTVAVLLRMQSFVLQLILYTGQWPTLASVCHSCSSQYHNWKYCL